MTFQRAAKAALEWLSGGRAWLDHGSNPVEVARLVADLRPTPIAAPFVRVGGRWDGGYVVPDDLEGVTQCISPGVSTEVSFDLAMADRGIHVVMADALVDGPPVTNAAFTFVKKHLDVYDDDSHVRMDTLVAGAGGMSVERILQMDIEGAEYPVLLDTSPECIRSFRTIVVEFHNLADMFGRAGFSTISSTFRKLLVSHCIVHIHPNNVSSPVSRKGNVVCPIMEFTLYRRDRVIAQRSEDANSPGVLDSDNVPGRGTVVLPSSWRPRSRS